MHPRAHTCTHEDSGGTIKKALEVLHDHGVPASNVTLLNVFANEAGLRSIIAHFPEVRNEYFQPCRELYATREANAQMGLAGITLALALISPNARAVHFLPDKHTFIRDFREPCRNGLLQPVLWNINPKPARRFAGAVFGLQRGRCENLVTMT